MTALLAAASPFDTAFGLPVHALVVHAVVILLPLAAIGGMAMAVRTDWSRRFGTATVLAAFIGTGAAFVASKSGQQLQSRVDTPLNKVVHAQIATHATVGRQVKYVAFALLVLVAVLWWKDRKSRDGGRRTTLVNVVAAVTFVASLGAVVWTVRAGDSGARAVWQTTVQHTKTGNYPVQG